MTEHSQDKSNNVHDVCSYLLITNNVQRAHSTIFGNGQKYLYFYILI